MLSLPTACSPAVMYPDISETSKPEPVYAVLAIIQRPFQKFCTLRLHGQQDDAIVLIFMTAESQTSVKNSVCVWQATWSLFFWKKKLDSDLAQWPAIIH